MNEDRLIELITTNASMSNTLAEFKGEMSSKIDTLVDEVKNLRDTDQRLYQSLGKRDEKMGEILGRLITLEAKSNNNWKWVMGTGTLSAALGAIGAFIMMLVAG